MIRTAAGRLQIDETYGRANIVVPTDGGWVAIRVGTYHSRSILTLQNMVYRGPSQDCEER
jgi:hypothetical protein